MRALAAFIMSGRLQAFLVALAGNLVPLVSPAAVGLVTLRRGYKDALVVLFGACAPLLAALIWASANPMVVMSSLATLAAVLIAAEVLKTSASWQFSLLATVAISSVAMLALSGLLASDAEVMVKEIQAALAAAGQAGDESVSPYYNLMASVATMLELELIGLPFVLGFLAWMAVVQVTSGLLLARWWQALLYNPGGFQQEFHHLRLAKVVVLGLVTGIVGLNIQGDGYVVWGGMLAMPLLLSGLALAHFVVKWFELGRVWLVILYVGVLIGPLGIVLIAAGCLDSIFDFRTRLAVRRG